MLSVRHLAAVVTLLIATALCPQWAISSAHAADPRISNTAIHAEADTYSTGVGVGTCKTFVQMVFSSVASAAGSPRRVGDGFYNCYLEAGGSQVEIEDVVRGDIVQVYMPSDPETYYWGMHVAIVVENRGDAVIEVIDANWHMDGRVLRHTWDLTTYLEEFPNLRAAAWRLGTVNQTPGPPVEGGLDVHRFYRPSTGTHFYTSSEEERRMVEQRWPGLFAYEGVAYRTDPSRNPQPLYRFYNRLTGGHFYTASSAEADTVMSQWSSIYRFDGQAYSVCPYPVSESVPVYRFYNVRNGNHFFTASEEEREAVVAGLPGTYQYEGTAFWLAQ